MEKLPAVINIQKLTILGNSLQHKSQADLKLFHGLTLTDTATPQLCAPHE
jgi:hypothetical protein